MATTREILQSIAAAATAMLEAYDDVELQDYASELSGLDEKLGSIDECLRDDVSL